MKTTGNQYVPTEALVSNEVTTIFESVAHYALSSLTCYIGIIGNVITIIVFKSQGYKETINISLTTIAIWDLLKCLFGAIFRITGPINVLSPELGLSFKAYTSLAAEFPSFFCTYVSAVLAAYVSVERCLCVSLPFTVKYLLTPRVVTSVMVVLSVLTFGSLSILYGAYKIDWVYHTGYNTTVAQLGFRVDSFVDYRLLVRCYAVINFFWPVISLGIQSLCTWIIFYHLRKSAKFRSSNAASTNDGKTDSGMTNRDRQVTKMLLVVIIIYMVNLFPRVVISIAKTVEPQFYAFSYYHNMFSVCTHIQSLFDFLNAAVNPFIYYFMSSQYKASILKMFCN